MDIDHHSEFEVTYRIKLAWALAGYLERLNYEITHLLHPNPVSLPAPTVKGDYAPDLIARDSDNKIAIGLAVDTTNIETHDTRTKLLDFASRYDTRTKLPVEFFIAVPDSDNIVYVIKNYYREQQIDKRKTNIRIVRLNIGDEPASDNSALSSSEPT
jgi:hypothetical protein